MATDDPSPTPGGPAAASLALPTLLASRPRLDALGIARVVSEAAEALHRAQRTGPLPGALTPVAIHVGIDGVTLAPGPTAVAYTAPERLTGAAGDRRSDVFTLGVVLWEALTGERLFDASTDEGRAKAVQACDVLAPTEFDDAIPPELDAICKRALARDPADRYPSPKVMAAELVTFLDDVGYPEDRAAIIERVRAAMPAPAPPAPDASTGAEDIASLLADRADDEGEATPAPATAASADDLASLLAGGGDDADAAPAPTEPAMAVDDIASLLAGGADDEGDAPPAAAPAPTEPAMAASDIASLLAGGADDEGDALPVAAPAPAPAAPDDIASLLAGGGVVDDAISADDVASLLGGGTATPADGAPAPKADPYAVEADPYAVEGDPDAMEDGDEPAPAAASSDETPTPYHALSTGEAVAPEEIDRLIATAQAAPAARATTAEGATTAAAEPPADKPTEPPDKPAAARPRRSRKAIAFASAGAAVVLAAVAAITLLGGRGEAAPPKTTTREAPPAAHGDAPAGDESQAAHPGHAAGEHATAAHAPGAYTPAGHAAGEHTPAARASDEHTPAEPAAGGAAATADDLAPANEFAPAIVDARGEQVAASDHAPEPPPIADTRDAHAPPPAPPATPPPARPAHVDTDPDFAPEAPRVVAADAPTPVYFPAKEPAAGLRRARQAPDRDHTPSRDHAHAPAVDPTTGPLEPVSGRGVTVDRAGNIDTTLLYRLGYELLSHGDATAARSTFESLQAQHPSYAPAARGLGLAQEALSNTTGARAAYTRYLELAPTAVDAGDIKSRLARLR